MYILHVQFHMPGLYQAHFTHFFRDHKGEETWKDKVQKKDFYQHYDRVL